MAPLFVLDAYRIVVQEPGHPVVETRLGNPFGDDLAICSFGDAHTSVVYALDNDIQTVSLPNIGFDRCEDLHPIFMLSPLFIGE